MSREFGVLNGRSEDKSVYENLCFKHKEGFLEWIQIQRFSPDYILRLRCYFTKHYSGKTFKTPFDLQKYIFNQGRGYKGLILASRAYLKFCEETGKEDLTLIDKYRKVLKKREERKDYYVPSNEEVIKNYDILKGNKALRLLYLVLATAGIRVIEALEFLNTYDESKFIVHKDYVTYNVSDLRHTKNINNIYLPKFVYEQLEHINNEYKPIHGNVKDRGASFSLKYLRKWHYNFMIYCQVPESVADFVQGRASKSIGANHYMAKSQQAEFWYAKIVEEFEKIINPL